jgi:hypothetical protein
MMKKLIVVLMMVVLCFPAYAIYEETHVIGQTDSNNPDMQIIATRYEPFPAEPGEYVELWLKIANEGSEDAEDVSLVLEPDFPFYLDGSEDPVRNFGKVLSHSIVLAQYKVRVDKDAVEGDNILGYKYRLKEGGKWKYGQIHITVQTIDAALSVESVETTPERIAPGQKSEVKITLKNLADSVMKDVSLTLDVALVTIAAQTAGTVTTAGTAHELLPIAPIDSATEKRVRFINPGEEHTFVYTVMAYPDAASRVYKVPIQIQYYDELDKEYIKSDFIGLIVGTEPDLSVTLESYEAGTASVRFTNKGLIDIKLLNVELEESDDYEIVSEDNYVGNIDSDDYETADFTIKTNMLGNGKIVLPLHIEYLDANNNKYSEDIDVPVKLQKQEKNGSKLWLVIALIVILTGVYLLYRRWEKKKKKQGK